MRAAIDSTATLAVIFVDAVTARTSRVARADRDSACASRTMVARHAMSRSRAARPEPAARRPLARGRSGAGYLHLLDERAHGNYDHGDPEFDAEIAYTIEHGSVLVQNNNNLRLTVQYSDVQRACHSNRWGFRVILATNAPPFPPPTWRPDGLPTGVITAFRLPSQPSS
jgi:hypothetical protein